MIKNLKVSLGGLYMGKELGNRVTISFKNDDELETELKAYIEKKCAILGPSAYFKNLAYQTMQTEKGQPISEEIRNEIENIKKRISYLERSDEIRELSKNSNKLG